MLSYLSWYRLGFWEIVFNLKCDLEIAVQLPEAVEQWIQAQERVLKHETFFQVLLRLHPWGSKHIPFSFQTMLDPSSAAQNFSMESNQLERVTRSPKNDSESHF